MNIMGLVTLQGLTLLARTLRKTAHAGLWLVDTTEALEGTVDALAAKAGHTVEAVYAPLWTRG